MPEQHNTLDAKIGASVRHARKPWRTPLVIVSTLSGTEAKNVTPGAEISPFASPSAVS